MAIPPSSMVKTTACGAEHGLTEKTGDRAPQSSASIVKAASPLFHFAVSRDEEHVHLRIQSAGLVFDLGERIHHYALLLLVRQAVADARRGLDRDSVGWTNIADLAKMLGLDRSHLHVQVFRLLRQIAGSGLPPAQTLALIERRRGQLRVVGIAISIVQGAQITFEDLVTGISSDG